MFIHASFRMNYCINVAWHGDNQPVALLRFNGSPGCVDHLLCWDWCLSFSSWQYPIDPLWGSGQASLKEAWSALKIPGRWLRCLWTSENTVDQHQQMTWQPESSQTVETSHWTSSNMDSVPLHICFWRCFCFRSGMVAIFLKMSECGDSWCTDSGFSPLLVKLSQVFESALLDCILKLAVIPVACANCPTQFLPSSELCI